MRPLAKTDHSRSHLSVLSVLTSTPAVSFEDYTAAFDALRACPSTYFTLVIVNRSTDQIVGVGCVFIEQKFIRGLGKVGHIEDIAVDKAMQGRKLGLRIIQALAEISERVGCYKTILNCSDSNIRMFQFSRLLSYLMLLL
jgi:glucosamine-phosphate N-acetyltransferase